MTNSIRELEDAKFLFVIGSNTTEAHPIISYFIKRAVKKGATLVVNDPRKIDLVRWAKKYIPLKVGTDVAYINGLAREIIANDWHKKDYIDRFTEGFDRFKEAVEPYTLENTSEITGLPVETIREVARMLAEAPVVSLVYTLGITEHTCGTHNVKSCANLQLLLGNVGVENGGVNPLRGQNNVQGACDMAALPNVLPGYQNVVDPALREKFQKAWNLPGMDAIPGLTMPAMFDGVHDNKIKALYVYGENIVLTEPHKAHTVKTLEKCEFVICGDIFYTETAAYADVILPDLSWGEEDGTFTNTERRVQRVRAALKPQGNARSHWWALNELGKRMGVDMGFQSAAQIFEEVRSLVPAYQGITWDRIEHVGLQWPCPTLEHPGTKFLHMGGKFTRGKGLFSALKYTPPAECPDEEYPMWLSTGRRLWHYHTGTQTHNSVGMDSLCSEEWLEINPADAAKMGIKTGDIVKASSRRGEITLKAWVTDRSPVDLCWTSFHFAEACANELTNDAFDPITNTAEYKACAIRVEKVADGEPMGNPLVPNRQARP